MKICVYAICKNEAKFLERWMNSVIDEADYIAVLDTGSTDETFTYLENYYSNSHYSDDWNHKAKIFTDQIDMIQEYGYMDFSVARNRSLSLIPLDTDICVVLDLDQIPVKGWSNIIKKRFAQGYTEVHGDIVDHDRDGKELNRWRSRNVHPNSPFWIWTRIIHEGIEYYGKEENKIIYDSGFIINHYPDLDKDRSQYKFLLEKACELYPKDPYYGIYLGMELSRRGTRQEAAEACRKALERCDFTDKESIQYQIYLNLALCTDDLEEAKDAVTDAFLIGISTNIKTRRAYSIRADIYEKEGDYKEAIKVLEEALTEVQSYSSDWMDDKKYFTGDIEDRLSLLYYYKACDYLKAIEYCVKALQYNPNNSRINENLKYYYTAYIKSKEITSNGK